MHILALQLSAIEDPRLAQHNQTNKKATTHMGHEVAIIHQCCEVQGHKDLYI